MFYIRILRNFANLCDSIEAEIFEKNIVLCVENILLTKLHNFFSSKRQHLNKKHQNRAYGLLSDAENISVSARMPYANNLRIFTRDIFSAA